MNLIPKIAELLGVEIGEEFKVKTDNFTSETLFRITESGAECSVSGEDYCDADHNMFCAILAGKYEIVKLPFEPKNGDRYFRVFLNLHGDVNVCGDTWMDWTTDYMCKYCGNCFRTEAEAEKHKYEIYEKLTGKKWGGEQ